VYASVPAGQWIVGHLFALFLVSFIGQALTGWKANAEELRLHELP
jgi:hypothetical protein